MNINGWAFTFAMMPLVFIAWVKAYPLTAVEFMKTLKRKRLFAIAHKNVSQKVNAEYRTYRKQAITQGIPASMIDDIQKKRKAKVIHHLTEKLYRRWLLESGNA